MVTGFGSRSMALPAESRAGLVTKESLRRSRVTEGPVVEVHRELETLLVARFGWWGTSAAS